jgi:hypothetical protein
VFLLNSRLEIFSCGRHEDGRPYRELTAAILPSSLRRSSPFTLAHLRLPTCVGFRYGSYVPSLARLFWEKLSIELSKNSFQTPFGEANPIMLSLYGSSSLG